MSTNMSDDFKKMSKAYKARQKKDLDRRLTELKARQKAEISKGAAAVICQFTKKELVAIHQALSFTDGEGMLYEPSPSAGRGYSVKFARDLIAKAERLAEKDGQDAE